MVNPLSKTTINIKKPRSQNDCTKLNCITQSFNISNALTNFTNIHELNITNCYYIRDPIAIHELFKAINSLKRLEHINISMSHKRKLNSYALLYNIVTCPLLEQLKTFRISNVEIDNMNDDLDTVKEIIKSIAHRLKSINTFEMKLKNRIHHTYLNNINKNSLEKLYIKSSAVNLFNDHYTLYDLINRRFYVRKFLSLPALVELNCNLRVSEIEALFFIMDLPTRKHIRKTDLKLDLILDSCSKCELARMLARVNEVSNLESLIIRNLPTYVTKHSSQKKKIDMNCSLRHIDVSELVNKPKTLIKKMKPDNFQDTTALIFKYISKISSVQSIVINLKRFKLKFPFYNKFKEKLDSYSGSPEILIIRDADVFQYFNTVLETLFASLKYVIVMNISKSLDTTEMLHKTTYITNFTRIINKYQKAGKVIYFHQPMKYIVNIKKADDIRDYILKNNENCLKLNKIRHIRDSLLRDPSDFESVVSLLQ